MAASTTVLPALTCMARDRPTSSAAVVFAARPANWWPFVMRPVPGGESAGCVRLQWLVLRAVCLPAAILPAMRTTLLNICPRSFASSLLAPIHCALPRFIPCAPGSSVRASSLLGPAVCQLRELSRWQLQHGPAVAARATGPFDCIC